MTISLGKRSGSNVLTIVSRSLGPREEDDVEEMTLLVGSGEPLEEANAEEGNVGGFSKFRDKCKEAGGMTSARGRLAQQIENNNKLTGCKGDKLEPSDHFHALEVGWRDCRLNCAQWRGCEKIRPQYWWCDAHHCASIILEFLFAQSAHLKIVENGSRRFALGGQIIRLTTVSRHVGGGSASDLALNSCQCQQLHVTNLSLSL